MANPVDPAQIAQIGIYKIMKKPTFDRYVKTWNDFRVKYQITTEKPPVQEDYLNFFQSLKDQGIHITKLQFHS